MDVPEPEQTPFTAVTTQTSKLARVSLPECCDMLGFEWKESRWEILGKTPGANA